MCPRPTINLHLGVVIFCEESNESALWGMSPSRKYGTTFTTAVQRGNSMHHWTSRLPSRVDGRLVMGRKTRMFASKYLVRNRT